MLRGEGELREEAEEEGAGEARLPLCGGWLEVGTGWGGGGGGAWLSTDSGLVRDREEAGEGEGRPDLAGDTAEAALDTEPGEAGCCWLPGLVCCRRGSLLSAPACCFVLLLLISFSMCSCSRA